MYPEIRSENVLRSRICTDNVEILNLATDTSDISCPGRLLDAGDMTGGQQKNDENTNNTQFKSIKAAQSWLYHFTYRMLSPPSSPSKKCNFERFELTSY